MIDIRWERPLHKAGTAIATAAGHLIVHERHTRLVSLDPADGSVRWDVPVGTWPRAVVLAGARCLVLPQNTDRLLCLDLTTGERLWAADPAGRFTGHVVVVGDVVVTGGWRGYTPLRALDLATGRLRWDTGRTHTVLPAAADTGLLVGRPGDRVVRLLHPHDGRSLTSWTLPQPLADTDNRPAFVADGAGGFLVRCGDRAVVRLGTDAVLVEAEHALAPVAPGLLGGRLWLWEARGGCTVADAADGRALGRIEHDQRLVPAVVPAPDGFAVGDVNGVLHRVDGRGGLGDRVVVGRRIRALHEQPDGLLVLTKGSLRAVRPWRRAADR